MEWQKLKLRYFIVHIWHHKIKHTDKHLHHRSSNTEYSGMLACNQWASTMKKTKHQRNVLFSSSSSSSSSSLSFSSSSSPPSVWLTSTRRPLCQLGRPLLTEQMHAGTERRDGAARDSTLRYRTGWLTGWVGVGGWGLAWFVQRG